jgi:hypothetical protein
LPCRRPKARSNSPAEAGGGGGGNSTCAQCGRGHRQVQHWICCDQCQRWFCIKCADIRQEDLPLYDDSNPDHQEFICAECNGGSEAPSEASEDDFAE